VSDLWAGKTEESSRPCEPPDELWAGREGPCPRRLGPGRRTQLAARIGLVVIVIGGPLVLGWVGLDLLVVRSSLQETQGALRDLRTSVGEVDLIRSQDALAVAEREIGDASRRSRRFTWAIASFVPVVGPTVQVTREVVDVAAASVDVASIAVRDGRQLVGEGVEVRVVDGQVDLRPLLQAQTLLASLPLERLVAARDALAEPRTTWVPDVVRDGRAEVLDLADDAIGTIERAEALTTALPGFLGVDGPRAYFVGLQTSAELRGTGGMVGYWGVLSVADGRVSFGDSEDYDPFDDAGPPQGETRTERVASIGLSPTNPPDTDPAYYARYGFAAGARSFPNINLDPDLPTTAKAMLDLFEHQTGQRLDGVVLLDPVGLQGLLESTGSTLPLSDELEQLLGFERGMPIDSFAQYVTFDLYESLGFGRSGERKDALRGLGDAAFEVIFDGRWESGPMARAVVAASTQRNLQIFTVDEDVQAAFRDVGATGELAAPPGADLFALTANNIVGGKQDVHLGHEVSFDIALDDVRTTDDGELSVARRVGFTATVDNPLPSSGMDDYIIGNCYVPSRVNRCFDGEPGDNRSWFSLWASPVLQVTDFRSDDGTAPNSLDATFRNLRVIDHLQLTPAQRRSSFGFEGDGRAPLRDAETTLVYEFLWWRQAKATPDLLEVRVTPPADWAVARVEVVGGGSGRGMGVHGEGEELTAEVVDGVATLRGTVTADTRLRVHLAGQDDARRQTAARGFSS
jgi:hypothetical protein